MAEKKKYIWFPVFYMFVVTVVFSSVLIGFSKFTRKRVEANQRLAFEKAVVAVLPTGLDVEKISGLEIHQFFTDKLVRLPDAGGAFCLFRNGKLLGYALPIGGQGFWAPIKGVIGIGPDKNSIVGIEFYEQNETPGLGAEIDKQAFKDQFGKEKNLTMSYSDEPIRIVRPSAELGKNEVHAITGATQTSTRLAKFLNEDLKNWQQAVEGGRQ